MRTARKHIIWYTRALVGGDEFCDGMNRLDDCPCAAAGSATSSCAAMPMHHERLAYAPVLH